MGHDRHDGATPENNHSSESRESWDQTGMGYLPQSREGATGPQEVPARDFHPGGSLAGHRGDDAASILQ